MKNGDSDCRVNRLTGRKILDIKDFSTFPQYFFIFLKLVFLFTVVGVILITEKVVFLLDFYRGTFSSKAECYVGWLRTTRQ
jgi:hypothetical protein